MLKFAGSIRFTSSEADDLRAIGIDVSGVKSPHDFAAALEPWLQALADVRPDVFEKIGREIAAAKGIPLPLDCAALLRVSEGVAAPAPHRPHRAELPQRVPQARFTARSKRE